MIRRALLAAIQAALLCAFAAPAFSQHEITPRPGPAPRGYVEYFAAGMNRLSASGETGLGARLMVRVAPASSPLGRLAVGGYVAHLPRRAESGETWEYGSQVDAHLRGAAAPLDPMLTLSAGAARREGEWVWQPTARRATRVFRDVVRTGYTLSPGVAARARVTRVVAVRGDLRRAFALDHNARGGTEIAVGISLPF
jgi:hypothetical protein